MSRRPTKTLGPGGWAERLSRAEDTLMRVESPKGIEILAILGPGAQDKGPLKRLSSPSPSEVAYCLNIDWFEI